MEISWEIDLHLSFKNIYRFQPFYLNEDLKHKTEE